MAHDVNQSEMDVAARVRSALVEKISSERVDLWIPEDTQWEWLGNALRLRFSSDFTCQLAKKMLLADFCSSLQAVTQASAEVLFEATRDEPRVARKPVAGNPVARKKTSGGSTVGEDHTTQDSPQAVLAAGYGAERADSLGLSQTTGPVAAVPLQVSSLQANSLQANSLQASSLQASCLQGISLGADNSPTTELSVASMAPAVVVPSAQRADARIASRTATAISRPRSIWDSFVPGGSNRLAWTTANMVVEEPGRLSPVLIHGPCGCGKSMLIAAIVQRLRSQRRMLRVVHMTSEQFTNDFTEGLRGGGLPMFRRKYRDVEALVLDDIQFLAGKKSTIAEFKHTLDNLVRLGKQVIVTADRSLNDMHFLGNELVGRLRGGLVTPLFPIDEELRQHLLTRRLQQARLSLSTEIVQQLASRICGDGRVISGIVNRLIAVASLNKTELDWETCWSAVCDLVQATQPVVRLGDIERAVCSMFGLDSQSLQTSSKHRSVTQPRMLAMFLARKYTPAAYHEIGQYFGRRKHSTVISAEKTVSGWLSDNPGQELARGLSVRDAIRQVEAQLQVG